MANGLQPQARPVNTFAPPEVRFNPRGVEAMQLAQALSSIVPELGRIAANQFEAHKDRSAALARREQAKFENMKQFMEAVKRGEIKESLNPWYMAQMREELGRKEAYALTRELYDAYLRDPDLVASDDPAVVEEFLNERIGEALKDRSIEEVDAMVPVLQQFGHNLVKQHVNIAADIRIADRKAVFTDALLAAIDAQDWEGVTMAVKNAEQTIPRQALNEMVRETAAIAAITKLDADIYRQVLEQVPTAGGTLYSKRDEWRMQEIKARVDQARLQQERAEAQESERVNKEIANKVAEFALTRMVEAQASGQPFDVVALLNHAVPGLPPGARRHYVNAIHSFVNQLNDISQEQSRTEMREVMKTVLPQLVNAGVAGDVETVMNLSILLQERFGVDAQAAIENALEFIYRFRNMDAFQWGRSNPDDSLQFWTGIHTGEINANNISQWARRVTQEDYRRGVQIVLGKLVSPDDVLAQWDKSVPDLLEQRIARTLLETGWPEDQIVAAAQTRVSNALTIYHQERMKLLTSKEFRDLSAPEKIKRYAQWQQDILRQLGGYASVDEWRQELIKEDNEQKLRNAEQQRKDQETLQQLKEGKSKPKFSEGWYAGRAVVSPVLRGEIGSDMILTAMALAPDLSGTDNRSPFYALLRANPVSLSKSIRFNRRAPWFEETRAWWWMEALGDPVMEAFYYQVLANASDNAPGEVIWYENRSDTPKLSSPAWRQLPSAVRWRDYLTRHTVQTDNVRAWYREQAGALIPQLRMEADRLYKQIHSSDGEYRDDFAKARTLYYLITRNRASESDIQRYINTINRIVRLDYALMFGGATPEIVADLRKKDPDAHLRYRMFIDLDELRQRGRKVAEQLGLSESEYGPWVAQQKALIQANTLLNAPNVQYVSP